METHKGIISPTQNQAGLLNFGFHRNANKLSFKSENFPDEPIDLTVTSTDSPYQHRNSNSNENFACDNNNNMNRYLQDVDWTKMNPNNTSGLDAQPFEIVNCPEVFSQEQQYDYCISRKRKRRKFVYTNEGRLVLVTDDNLQDPQAFNQAKQLDILKAAKSLFSKRTRTLYHWMYPTCSKQQIKTTVLTSWDSLAESEKAFYISQVLGRFGLSQSNLMINPQLGSIKKLPPIVEKVETPPKSQELQSAITSITTEPNVTPMDVNYLTLDEFEAMRPKTRKRRGRPRGNAVKRLKIANEDFQDDPELSQELEQFAVKFNLNMVY